MKKINFFGVFPLLFTCCLVAQTKTESQKKSTNEVSYINTITASELKAHLSIVASDSMEGRDTGSEGQKKPVVI